MLTVELVKAHSEVSIGHDESKNTIEYLRPDRGLTRSMARLLYIHNGHASKMRIICRLPEVIPSSEIGEPTEEYVKATIDWDKFTRWINRHDDLAENNLVSVEDWSAYHVKNHKKIGRNGLLDTLKNEVIDCNKIVLV